MDLNLASALGKVQVAMKETADKAGLRRLRMYGDKVPCKPACAACCNRLVFITVAEAMIMHTQLTKSGKWDEVKARAAALVPLAKNTPVVAWFKMNLACPVLDPQTRLCTSFESRPSPCSTHFVFSDPSLCDSWSAKSGAYELVDMDDLHVEFEKALATQIDGHGILALRLPMPIALLFAEKIRVQSLSPNEIVNLIYNEFR